MGRRLFLHIGDCKTGSTILQSMLARRDCRAEGIRLFYPGKLAHGALAGSLSTRKDLYPNHWQNIAKRLDNAEWDVAVLSSELFEFASPEAVAGAVRDHLPGYADKLTVIAYVRPHAARAVSQFAENLKLGQDTGDFKALLYRFLKAGRLNYADRLARWQQAFGDRLIVRPYLRSWFPDGDVRRDFLAQILPGARYELADGQDANTALPVSDLTLMRMLHMRFQSRPGTDPENRVAFGKQFGRLLQGTAPTVKTERLRLPLPLYDRIRHACAADAEKLDATWIGAPCFAPALDAARADTLARPQSLDCRDYYGPEIIRLMQAWADLLLRQMDEEKRLFAQRLRPRE